MLFGHVASEWWSMQTASERTRQDYRTLLNSQVLPALGDVSIIDVTKARVQQLILEMPVAPATANKALFMVKSILDHATEEGVIPRNPARAVKRLRVDRKPLNVWSMDQVDLFLKSFPGDEVQWKTFSEVLLLAGLRFSEAAALTPRQVTAQTLRVDQAWDETGRRIKPTKSGRARSVDMPPRLQRDLLAYVENTGVERDGFLFPGKRGGVLSKSWFNKKVWRPAIRRAGLPYIRPHDARHTYVTLLLDAGENPVYVKEQAGHYSAAFTLDVYGHLVPSRKRAHNLPTNQVETGDPR
jgi:integrase